MGVEVSEINIVLDTETEKEKGALLHIIHYCAIPPLPAPPYCPYNIVQYIFPTPPFILQYAIKYWQYLVRANLPAVAVACSE